MGDSASLISSASARAAPQACNLDLAADAASAPGRSCPISYRYTPSVFRRPIEYSSDVLYVVGGLYGNPFALDALLDRAAGEPVGAQIVFNGDFHWFDIDQDTFARIDDVVARHGVVRGNVETELAVASDQAGCGCGYPEWVSDAEVARSNRIIELLRHTAAVDRSRLDRLAQRPMHALAQVGDARIGIVHGDCWSLAGWSFAQERLDADAHQIVAGFLEADVDVFASSHTCLPVARAFSAGGRDRLLINNGAAGMPNFAGTQFGVVTRIALSPAPDALYRARLGRVLIESIPIRYDIAGWQSHFEAGWPAGSPASESYLRRISQGPAYSLEQAVRTGFEVTA